ncbi:cysteine protease StiP family protein [Cytobacillus gottheilii]|uniref:cysteine protease StiP family protein n=1 Tax=Cytobacillus gottheilii TaxID=859144 RepID=UPI0009BC6E2D|nr:cysteine protease StiP family protein [Cytobacillus gottheilii]
MKYVKEERKFGSYDSDDVIFLLKDLSNYKLEGPAEQREKNIQSGQHYSESLPIEYQPPDTYMNLFLETLETYKRKVALSTGVVTEQVYMKKGKDVVLVSLARAGTPVGILMKRYLKEKYQLNIPHYSISIIRDRGIDENALHYILKTHPDKEIQFVDGWTGKGAISIELTKSCQQFQDKYGIALDDTLAVIADPGHCTTLYGTREDFLIPSACLNSTVSGLVSRTVLNDHYIGPEDFHGAKYYDELSSADVSNDYISVITAQYDHIFYEAYEKASKIMEQHPAVTFSGMASVKRIQDQFGIDSSHFVKPGVGETTRVLLRRVPWKILVKDQNSPFIRHIKMLAEERGVEMVEYRDMDYTCCGLIKKVEQ